MEEEEEDDPNLYCCGLLNKTDSSIETLCKILCYIPLSPFIICYMLIKNCCIFFCNFCEHFCDCI